MRSALCRTTLALLLAVCLVARGENFVLKDGKTISGKEIGRTKTDVMVRLDSGGLRNIKIKDLAEPVPTPAGEGTAIRPGPGPAGTDVSSSNTGASGRTVAEEPPRRTGPSLADLVTNAVEKILRSRQATTPGYVVLQKGEQVYIDLGGNWGAAVGDKFEVADKVMEIRHPVTDELITSERNVLAELQVETVQPKLSVCKILSGKLPDSLPKGPDALKVLPKKTEVFRPAVGTVEVAANTPISAATLTAAITEALKKHGDTATPAEASHLVTAACKRGERGVTVSLSLLAASSGATVGTASFEYMPETRYRTAFDVSLGLGVLDLGPIEAQARQVYDVEKGEDFILMRKVGANLHDVAVMKSGSAIVLVRESLQDLKQLDKALGTLTVVTDTIIKPVRSDIKDRAAFWAWFRDLTVYSSQGNIYHRVCVMKEAEGISAVLGVPNVQVFQADMIVDFSNDQDHGVHLGSVSAVLKGSGARKLDITSAVRYGEQEVTMNRSWVNGHDLLVLQFLTDGKPGQFVLFDNNRAPMGTVMRPCRSILDLNHPFMFQ